VMHVEFGRKYVAVRCRSERLCVCMIRDEDTAYFLRDQHVAEGSVAWSAFPDYPPEYCVPLDMVTTACRAYAEDGNPNDRLLWGVHDVDDPEPTAFISDMPVADLEPPDFDPNTSSLRRG